ncbi:TetR/AcrR family transcriptional regulator [Photobacterium leiognathi subsp. mandapamensis]
MKKTKYNLIASMAELILEKGLANTSPQDVLDRANLGKGSFYHYFAGKEDLAYHAIKFNIDRLIEESTYVLEKEKTAHNKIMVFLNKQRNIDRGCFAGQMARDPMIMANPKLANEVTRGFEWFKSTLEKLIRQGIADGTISSHLAPLEATTIVVSILQGSYVSAKGFQDETYFYIGLEALKKLLVVDD